MVPALEQFAKGQLGLSLSIRSDQFKVMIGIIELISVILLWTGKQGATFAGLILGILMLGAALSHILIKESPSFPLSLGFLAFLIAFLSMSKKVPGVKKSK